MTRTILRRLLPASGIACLLLLAVGCSRMGDDTTTSRGGTTGRDTSGMYGNNEGMQTGRTGSAMADAGIVAELQMADSHEVALVKHAEDRISNAQVKEFARMLMDEHQKNSEQLKDIIKEENLTPKPSTGSMDHGRLDNAMSSLQTADRGNAYDAAFLQLVIEDHQRNIDEMKRLQSQASSERVKRHIDRVLPTMEKHLDRARTLLQDIGTSQSGR
jgi:putative membrane protein